MRQYSYKNLIYILPAIFVVFAMVFITVDKATKLSYAYGGRYVEINNIPITVMVADEPMEHWQGLSDRESLGGRNGMLFVFKQKQDRVFVMRRMHFPLDIIFIKDDKIVKIHKRLEPEGETPNKHYSSDAKVNYVLEVNGGFTDAFGVKEGDRVKIEI